MKKRTKLFVAFAMMLSLVNIFAVEAYATPCSGNCHCEMTKKDKSNMTIVEVVSNDKQFKTLAKALEAAGLVDTLKGEGPFTVFAPTDEAFAKLPKGTLEDLLKPENKNKLTNILTYHVTPGKVMAEDVVKLNGKDVKMANGKTAKVEVKGKEVCIDGVKVVVTDIVTKNGVIHVIDAVMTP